MHHVITKTKPNNALCYQENQDKRYTLSEKSNQTMRDVIKEVK